jgi:hypothetical protein
VERSAEEVILILGCDEWVAAAKEKGSGDTLSGVDRSTPGTPTPHFAKKSLDLIENKGLRHQKMLSKTTKMAVEIIFEAFVRWGAWR